MSIAELFSTARLTSHHCHAVSTKGPSPVSYCRFHINYNVFYPVFFSGGSTPPANKRCKREQGSWQLSKCERLQTQPTFQSWWFKYSNRCRNNESQDGKYAPPCSDHVVGARRVRYSAVANAVCASADASAASSTLTVPSAEAHAAAAAAPATATLVPAGACSSRFARARSWVPTGPP